MKNKLIILFIFSCLLSSFTSFYGCQESAVSPPIVEGFPEDGKVSITTDVVEKASRTTSQTYLGEHLGLSLDYGVGHKYSVTNIEWNQVDGVWQGVEQMLWADETTPTHLYAYAPYVAGASDMSAIPFTVASDQQTDAAMLASDLVGYVANGFVPVDSDPATPSLDERGRVAIAFSHKLSRLDLRLVLGDQFDGTGVTVTQVEVMGMNHAALYDAMTAGVSVNATTPVSTPVIMQRQGAGSYRAIVVPQTVATGETMLQVTLSDGKMYGYTVNVADGHTFASGATHSMHLRVGKNKLELDGEVVVEPWPMGEEITGGEGNIEWDEIAYSEMSVDNYPSSNYWKITGVIADYRVIGDVLQKVYDTEDRRPIHLLLPDQIELQSLILSSSNCVASISCPQVKYIHRGVFSRMGSLMEVSIPKVEEIDEEAFHDVPNLERIDVSESPNYIMEDGVLMNKERSLLVTYLFKNNRKRYVAPPTLKKICTQGFGRNDHLEEAILPDVDTLAYGVFYDCSKLKKVYCPNVKLIGDDMFINCNALVDVDVSNSPNYVVEDGGLYTKDKTELFYFLRIPIEEYIAPLVTKKIRSEAFSNYKSLKSVILPSVEEIGALSFSLTSLESVNGPVVKTVAHSLFWYCRNLKSVDFPEVRVMSSYIFGYCYSLQQVRLATSSVALTLDQNTFDHCNTEQVTLITGDANGSTIDGLYWEVKDRNGTIHRHGPFKEIILE